MRKPVSLYLTAGLFLSMLIIAGFSGAQAQNILQNRDPITSANAAQLAEVARFGQGLIREIAYSSDANLIAVATNIGVSLYDPRSLSEEPLFIGGGESGVAFSADGLLAYGARDGSVRIWDTVWRAQRAVLPSVSGGGSLAFSPEGSWLANAFNGTLEIWDTSTWEKKSIIGTQSTNTQFRLAFSPDGTRLATGGSGGRVVVYNVPAGTVDTILQSGPDSPGNDSDTITSIAFSPDGRLLASGSADGAIRLWGIKTLRGHTAPVTGLAFSLDSSTLVSVSTDGTLRHWKVTTGEELTVFSFGNVHYTSNIVFTSGEATLAGINRDGTFSVWDAMIGDPVQTAVYGHVNWVHGVAFNPDASLLVSTGEDALVFFWSLTHSNTSENEIRLWTPFDDRARTVSVYTDNPVDLGYWWRSVQFSPDGQTLAVGNILAFSPDWSTWAIPNFEEDIQLVDIATGEVRVVLENSSRLYLWSVVFSPDGSLIAAGGDDDEHAIRLWDTSSGRQVATLTGHEGRVNTVAFSPDGKTLASGAWDSTIRLWDISSESILSVLTIDRKVQVWDVTFSPDGSLLASGDYSTIRIWDVATGAELVVIRDHSWLNDLAFSPDGTLLASASSDGTVRLWGVPGDPGSAG